MNERIQSLWSGYGELVRVVLDGGPCDSVIVKWVNPPAVKRDVSHERKCRSYAVETAWYSDFAVRCDDTCRVPKMIAKRVGPARDERILILEDLDSIGFDRRTHRPNSPQIESCLSWLASFHARFLGEAPNGLWKTGTYWHLSTRREELLQMKDASLREAAPAIDHALHACAFRTLVHGDAKPANFCFSRGEKVAAVDFQYVGGGCGMKDVAYLLDGESEASEKNLLDGYFASLRTHLANRSDVDAVALEMEWRRLYPIAHVDYLRFLSGWAGHDYRRDRRIRERVEMVMRSERR